MDRQTDVTGIAEKGNDMETVSCSPVEKEICVSSPKICHLSHIRQGLRAV